MIQFDFTYSEATLLHRILYDYLSELQKDMTANSLESLAELLKAEEALMQKILDDLEAHGIGVPSEIFGGYPE
jgi:hypothetical protein